MIQVQLVRQTQEVNIPQDDIVSIAEAARLSNRKVPTIAALMESGTLPWLELPFSPTRERPKRFTRKSAVMALPKLAKKQ